MRASNTSFIFLLLSFLPSASVATSRGRIRQLSAFLVGAFLFVAPFAARAAEDLPFYFNYLGETYRAPTFSAAFNRLQSLVEDGEFLRNTGKRRVSGGVVAWQIGYSDTIATRSSLPATYDFSSIGAHCSGMLCSDYSRYMTILVREGWGYLVPDGVVDGGWFCYGGEYIGQVSDFAHHVWVADRSDERGKRQWNDHQSAGHAVLVERDMNEDCGGPLTRHTEIVYASKKLPFDCLRSYEAKEEAADQGPLCKNDRRYEIFGPNDQVCEPTVGNPCGVLSGSKTQTEVDLIFGPLTISRTYRSQFLKPWYGYKERYGRNWWLSADRKIESIGPEKYWIDANGGYRKLENASESGSYVTNGSAPKYFDSNGAALTVEVDGRTEKYVFGKLVEVEDGGKFARIVWENDTVSHVVSNADVLRFIYNETGMLSQLFRESNPDATVDYTYDSSDRLVGVKAMDGVTTGYLYENAAFPHAITGVLKNDKRISTYVYDKQGMVVETSNSETGEHFRFERLENSVRVIDGGGGAAEYTLAYRGGRMQLSAVTGECAGCPSTDTESFDYDELGRIREVIRRSGLVETFERNANGQVIRESASSNGIQLYQIERTWSPDSGLLVSERSDSLLTSYQRDAQNKVTAKTETDLSSDDSRTTIWRYDDLGQMLSVDGPRSDVSDVTTFTYDNVGNIATVTNALGHVTQYTSYDAHGNPLTIIDPNGVATALEYDLRQRLVRRTVAADTADAATTAFDYGPAGQLERTTLPDGSWIAYAYDAAHRMTSVHDRTGNRIDYILDAMGNRIEERVSGPNGAAFRETFRTYNQLNRLVVESGAEGSRIEYGYDMEGHRASVMDANGSTTLNRYDALDRLFETVDALAGITRYTYDAAGNLVEVIDPRNVATEYIYNGFNELLETRSPDAGTTTYAYDESGNRVSQTDARGITVAYTYDALNRLTFIDYPGSEQDITYEYDALPNAIGRLIAITDETGHTEYSYDARGNLEAKASLVNGIWLPLNYSYDAADRLTEIRYPGGTRVRYGRDAAGLVTDITHIDLDDSETPLLANITHVPFGPVSDMTFGNGIIETRTFDREGRVTRIQSGNALDVEYQWSTTGNIAAIADHRDATKSQVFGYDALYRLTDAAGSYGNLGYQYDAVGNRVRVTDNGTDTLYSYASDSNRLTGISGPDGNVIYAYDENGNTLADGEYAFSYDARNRLSQAGSLTGSATSHTYTHNALGHRVSKSTLQVAVPGDASGDGIIDQNDLHILKDLIKGNASATPGADCNQDSQIDNRDISCIAKRIGEAKNSGKRGRDVAGTPAATNSDDPSNVVDQILFVYDEVGHLLGEYDEDGSPIRQYVWLEDRPVAMLKDGYIYYIHSDHLNTPKVVTDQSQQVVWKADYKPFGEAEPTVTTLDMPLRFPGQFFDSETNLHYNYFRSYDPATGRYGQSDPIGLAGGLNTYEYAASRPTNVYDASGLNPQCSCHVTCTSAPVTGLVFCTKTKICKGPCEEETTERRYGWYLWENKSFNFVSYYRCSDFPGALPNDPNIAPGLPPNPRSPFEPTRI